MSAKREDIIRVATELFSRHGFHPVGVDRILTEAGVARMTLYNHFPGKIELIAAVLERRYADIMASLHASVGPELSPEAQLRAIFTWHETWFASPEFSGCLFERVLAEFGAEEPALIAFAIQYKTTMTAWMGDILNDLAPKSAAERTAPILMMLLDGATIDARAFHDPTVATRAWKAAEILIAQAKGPAPPTPRRRR